MRTSFHLPAQDFNNSTLYDNNYKSIKKPFRNSLPNQISSPYNFNNLNNFDNNDTNNDITNNSNSLESDSVFSVPVYKPHNNINITGISNITTNSNMNNSNNPNYSYNNSFTSYNNKYYKNKLYIPSLSNIAESDELTPVKLVKVGETKKPNLEMEPRDCIYRGYYESSDNLNNDLDNYQCTHNKQSPRQNFYSNLHQVNSISSKSNQITNNYINIDNKMQMINKNNSDFNYNSNSNINSNFNSTSSNKTQNSNKVNSQNNDDLFITNKVEPDIIFNLSSKFIYSRNASIIVAGFTPSRYFVVLQHFHKFGKINNIDYNPGSDYMIIEYSDFNYSTIAVNNYDPFLLNENESIISCTYFNKESGKKILDKDFIRSSYISNVKHGVNKDEDRQYNIKVIEEVENIDTDNVQNIQSFNQSQSFFNLSTVGRQHERRYKSI